LRWSKNRVLIVGGRGPKLDPELIQEEIVEALIEAKASGELITEVYYQPSQSIESTDGFIVFCVPSFGCSPKVLQSAVINGLQSACPALSLNERFSIVVLEQTPYIP